MRGAALLVGGALVLAACWTVSTDLDLANGTAAGPGDANDGAAPAVHVESCAATSRTCQGLCIDVTSNVANCGDCGRPCKNGETCAAGRCVRSCPAGEVDCDGTCTPTSSDPRHCGSCTHACIAGEACGDARCASTCPTGQTNCSGSCIDVGTDPKSCGVCGKACGTNEECLGGSCVVACRTQLRQTLTDPWGWSWDGLERAASGFAAAQAECAQFRGRLPTVSELYRVSATQSAAVGQTTHTNRLWSASPWAAGLPSVVRLSDADVSSEVVDSSVNFRCVCPPPPPKAYIAGNCFGPAGAGCFNMKAEGGRYNLDARDRPLVPKATAVWECGLYGAHLASAVTLTEAIQQGIGGGIDDWLHTSDEVDREDNGVVKWSDGAGFVYRYTTSEGRNSLSYGGNTTAFHFRCAGASITASAHLGDVAGAWAGAEPRKIESADYPAEGYMAALSRCNANGGHLPTAGELGVLIARGLPGGTDTFTWTSDETGFDNFDFTVALMKWRDGALPFGAANEWAYKNASHPHRCIYYPVDATYAGPGANVCASAGGECFTAALPGKGGAKMWFDQADRPPLTVIEAITACLALGGHLPTERDLTEAIRAGLPNGSGNWLQTSDLERGRAGVPFLHVGVLKWSATNPQFDGLYPTSVTWGFDSEAKPYRCMWTNELR